MKVFNKLICSLVFTAMLLPFTLLLVSFQEAYAATALSDARVEKIVSLKTSGTNLQSEENFTYGPNDNIYLNMKIKNTTKSHHYDKVTIKVVIDGNRTHETVTLDGIAYDSVATFGINLAGVEGGLGQIKGWAYYYTFNDVASYGSLTFTAVYNDTWNTKTAVLNILTWDDNRATAPGQPVLTYNQVANKAVLTGVNNTMEYRLRSATSWTPCTNGLALAPEIPLILYLHSANTYIMRFLRNA